jgi:hypothetical protein
VVACITDTSLGETHFAKTEGGIAMQFQVLAPDNVNTLIMDVERDIEIMLRYS